MFITLQDGFNLIIVVGAPKNFQYLTEKGKLKFYDSDLPSIIVQKLIRDVIQEVIKAYIDDKSEDYWLK